MSIFPSPFNSPTSNQIYDLFLTFRRTHRHTHTHHFQLDNQGACLFRKKFTSFSKNRVYFTSLNINVLTHDAVVLSCTIFGINSLCVDTYTAMILEY